MPPEIENKPRKVTFDEVYELFQNAARTNDPNAALNKEAFREVLYRKIMELPGIIYRFWTIDEKGLHAHEMNVPDFLQGCDKHVKGEKREAVKPRSRRLHRRNL